MPRFTLENRCVVDNDAKKTYHTVTEEQLTQQVLVNQQIAQQVNSRPSVNKVTVNGEEFISAYKVAELCDQVASLTEANNRGVRPLFLQRQEIARMEAQLAEEREKVRRLEDEVHFLRQYGNRDCIGMADAALAEYRAEQVAG
jgi:uncharacterized small protein (DUF1192 family)